MAEEFRQKKELKKYRKFERVLHQFFAGVFVLLFLTGFFIVGGGEIFKVAHLISGYVFLILFIVHFVYLIFQGISMDLPIDAFPFYVNFSQVRRYLKENISDTGKFTFPERLDYLSLFILTTISGVSGFFLGLPQLIPGLADITTVFSILKIHYFAAIAFSFWIFGYHFYFTLIEPLPGNTPWNMLGKDLDIETLHRHRPEWFQTLKITGIIEAVENEVDTDKIDRDKVTALLGIGNELFKEGRFEEAEKLYREAIELYPSYSQAQYNLGMLFVKMGEKEKALKELHRFLEIDPFNPLAARVKRLIKEMSVK